MPKETPIAIEIEEDGWEVVHGMWPVPLDFQMQRQRVFVIEEGYKERQIECSIPIKRTSTRTNRRPNNRTGNVPAKFVTKSAHKSHRETK
jgi:hypothetical protein